MLNKLNHLKQEDHTPYGGAPPVDCGWCGGFFFIGRLYFVLVDGGVVG